MRINRHNVCLFIYLFTKHYDKIVLNGGEYDIGRNCDWNNDVYSLKFVYYYSKPLIIRAEGPSSIQEKNALKSVLTV